MGRIRTIKPEFFLHEDLFDAEIETGLPIRIAYAGLWTQADREGRFDWRPRTLKATILPFDECDFSRVLHALTTRGFLVHYASAGDEFGWIPTFKTHQVINNRESPSTRPDPAVSEVISHTSTRDARVDDASGTRGQSRKAEGKGKEGKGREEEPPISPPKGGDLADWFRQAWNANVNGLPKVTRVSASRLRAIRGMLKAADDDRDLVTRAIRAFGRWPFAHAKGLNCDTFLRAKNRDRHLEWADSGPPKATDNHGPDPSLYVPPPEDPAIAELRRRRQVRGES